MAKDNGNAGSSSLEKKKAVQTEGKWARWGRAGFDKSIKVSDWLAPYANKVSSAVGGERFWPQSDDMPLEIEKCERILRAFTVEGIQQKEAKEESLKDEKGNWIKKKVRVLRKIPPAAIRNAKGIAIFSSMRSGIAPLGGGGGSGLFLARLPDGSWSPPSAITPQSGAVGFLLGVDFLDVILLINSEKTLQTFLTHRIDLGAETGITAGPYGTGYSAEASYDRAPVYSYVRNRGAYAGIELLGQAFLHRFDENERFYYWPGISAADILTGKVTHVPPSVTPLHRALRDAETGRAQGGKLDRTEFDVVKIPESEVFKQLGPNYTSSKRFVPPAHPATPRSKAGSTNGHGSTAAQSPEQGIDTPEVNLEEAAKRAEEARDGEDTNELTEDQMHNEEGEIVQDGERLRLPPTPSELEMMEAAGIQDEEDLRLAQENRQQVYTLPVPPMHPDVRKHWDLNTSAKVERPTQPLIMNGPRSAEIRQAQLVPLPPSPPPELELSRGDAEEGTKVEESAQDLDAPEPDQQLLAQGIEDEQTADAIVLQALEGDAVEMKSEIKTADEKDLDEMSQHEDVPLDNTDSIAHEGKNAVTESGAIVDGAQNRQSVAISIDSTAEGQFASAENETFEDFAPTVAEEASAATAVPVTEPEVDAESDAGADAEAEAEADKTEDTPKLETDESSSPRPQTPTMTAKATADAGNADGSEGGESGTMTPISDDKRNATPNRPPRRKRPPQKKK